jgi:sulfofructose kinase
MKRITGIGANVFDTLITLPEYPAEDTKLKADSIVTAGGGPTATGLVAAAKLSASMNVSVEFIGSVAGDERGRWLLEDFARWGVKTDNVTIEPNCEAFCSFVMLSSAAKTRTCVFHRGNKPPLKLNSTQKEAVAGSEILMVDGNELNAAIEGAKIIRSSGGKVLYDAGGLYEGIENLLPLADLLIPSEEFALKFTGANTAEDAAVKLFETYSPEVVVITQGKRGGIVYDGKLTSYPIIETDVVDSNGAGDVFHGAFALASVIGWDYRKCAMFASATSSLKCTKVGARAAVPSFEEVIEILRKNGYSEY